MEVIASVRQLLLSGSPEEGTAIRAVLRGRCAALEQSHGGRIVLSVLRPRAADDMWRIQR